MRVLVIRNTEDNITITVRTHEEQRKYWNEAVAEGRMTAKQVREMLDSLESIGEARQGPWSYVDYKVEGT